MHFRRLFEDCFKIKFGSSKTVICGKKVLQGDGAFPEKYSVLNSHVFFFNFKDFSRTFLFF